VGTGRQAKLEGFGCGSINEFGDSSVKRKTGEKRGDEIERLGRGLICLLMVGKPVLAESHNVRAFRAQLL
jgi:nitroreductase